ncbi:MerR HTH family regulatory protein [Chryseolinea serpens]|uniref:MerR HTH family regulatory protein n=1 Tax=Chryseolinea serpens TaxID=947013 RepID=A0A1M5JNM6_9BACT|nr:chaperone modulator CbpM [Chryseolinea serpens]SHG42128.1 MerR HTH family regulatory protein [Chryseolinea serpens]
MELHDMIPARDFCIHHNLEVSFIRTLEEHGMIETVTIEETLFVPNVQLERLEKIVRLHADLDINLEGIDTIIHLLQRIEEQQAEIMLLKNRLERYED